MRYPQNHFPTRNIRIRTRDIQPSTRKENLQKKSYQFIYLFIYLFI